MVARVDPPAMSKSPLPVAVRFQSILLQVAAHSPVFRLLQSLEQVEMALVVLLLRVEMGVLVVTQAARQPTSQFKVVAKFL